MWNIRFHLYKFAGHESDLNILVVISCNQHLNSKISFEFITR